MNKIQENFGEEQIQYNMEKIGYRVGVSLVEKATKEEARFKENVEIVKYICKVNFIDWNLIWSISYISIAWQYIWSQLMIVKIVIYLRLQDYLWLS